MRPKSERIQLTEDEATTLIKHGFTTATVKNWRSGRTGPSRDKRIRIGKLLGWDHAKATVAVVTEQKPKFSFNACDTEELCIPVRRLAFRGVPGTLEDQRREIPCTNCREGIRREKVLADRKKRTANMCECGEPKSYGSNVCADCRDDNRRTVN